MDTYNVGYYTLSDGTRYVNVPATDKDDAERVTRTIYDDVDTIFLRIKNLTDRPESVYCNVCEDHIPYSELRKETRDDEYVYSVCPGCGNELLEPYLPF